METVSTRSIIHTYADNIGNGKASKSSKDSASKPVELPIPEIHFPSELFRNLPQFFQDCCVHPTIDSTEKDLLLISALTICSAALPNYFGYYDKRAHYSNLYFFVIGPPGSSKGVMGYGGRLGNSIHQHKRNEYLERMDQYETESANFAAKKKERVSEHNPSKPKQQLFNIPPNNSATGVLEVLANNPNGGVMFCSESDTLTGTLKQDWGDFTDLLRAAFHHEPYAYMRRGNEEYAEIQRPKLSILLSGTPRQLLRLLPDTENGLFSRFGFYTVVSDKSMKDVFKDDGADFERRFDELDKRLFKTYATLESLTSPILFRLTDEQKKKFHDFFSDVKKEFLTSVGDESIATSNRLGLMGFRIAMILNQFRLMELSAPGEGETQYCNDQDFDNSLTIIKTLSDHTLNVFSLMPIDQTAQQQEKMNVAVKLHNDGKSFQQIADQLDVKSKQVVHYWIKKAKEAKRKAF